MLGGLGSLPALDFSKLGPEDIEYRFLRLYSIDLQIARQTLALLRRYRRIDVRYALLRDAVVAYARPFSGNRDPSGKSHRLPRQLVPKAHRPLHDDLLNLRNQLFAHTDFAARRPTVMRWRTDKGFRYPLGFANPPYEEWLRRAQSIILLVQAVESSLGAKINQFQGRLDDAT